MMYNKSEEIGNPIFSDFSISCASYESCGNGGENKMSSLLFLGMLAFAPGFATFMGIILLISLFIAVFIAVVQITYYMLRGFCNLIWKIMPQMWRETAEKYQKEQQDEIQRGEIKRPPYVPFKKQMSIFVHVVIFGAAGLILSLLIVFLLIPFDLPDSVLQGIWIVSAVVLSGFFMVQSVHYSDPEYESWIKKKYFSKKTKRTERRSNRYRRKGDYAESYDCPCREAKNLRK